MKINISVDPGWALSGDGRRAGFVSRLMREAGRLWEDRIGGVSFSMLDCQFEYSGNEGLSSFAGELKKLIETVSDTAYDTAVFHVTIAENDKKLTLGADGAASGPAPDDLLAQINALRAGAAAEPPEEKRDTDRREARAPAEQANRPEEHPLPEAGNESAAEAPAAEEAEKEEAAKEPEPPAYEEIRDLVGCRDFKQLAEDIRNAAPQVLRNGTQKIFFSEIFLFSVDTGSGWHSSLRLLDGLLKETGLFKDSGKPETLSIPAFHDPEMAGKMKNAVSVLETALEKQRLLSVDISEWIGHTHTREFKKLAMELFRTNSRCAVVFRIPCVRPAAIEAAVRDISDVISVRPVVFEPFSGEELREIAKRYLDENSFSFTDAAWNLFDGRIEAEKADGYFYGVHTVRKIVGEMIRSKELLAPADGSGDKVIAGEAAAAWKAAEEKAEDLSLETLSRMVGMQEIAEKVNAIINQIVYSRKAGLSSKPTMHMCFTGNPGTGKTTVARIIGSALKERGVLRIGKFHEHHGQDLCAEYVGHTAPKTHAICQEAYGSVLFIDEAYSLAAGGELHSFGREAIDTLITEMENHSDDLIVIFAGYPDDIQRMIAMNPGMRSRIPYTIEFPNYTRDQLADIFMGMVNGSFACTEGLEERARAFFGGIPDEVLSDKTFGNGRYVRNVFERTWGRAVARSNADGADGIVISEEDFDEAVRDADRTDKRTEKRKIGF